MARSWQDRMAERMRRAALTEESCGFGWCTDEGDEHRPAVFEYSRLAALAAARSGDYGEYAKAHANSRDIKKQIAVADFIASADYVRSKGLIVKPDVTERQLGKAQFFARRAAGVEVLVSAGFFAAAGPNAEREWMKREAEQETGFKRNDRNPNHHREWWLAYNRLRAHDFR